MDSHQEFKISFLQSEYETIDEFNERYQIIRTIGMGGQAHVHEAVDQQTGTNVAIKIFKKRKMTLTGLMQAHQEYSMMKKMNEEKILSPHAYFECNRYICIVTDLMGSDVRELVSEFTEKLQEEHVCYIFRQMVQAL